MGRPEDVVFAVQKLGATATSAEKFLTKNVVYREVLLHRRRPPPPQVDSNPATITLEADHSAVLDIDSIYDNIGDDEEGDDQPRGENRIRPVTDLPTPMLSATLPSNVTLAPLPTAREAEVFVLKKTLSLLQNNASRLRLTWRVRMTLTKLGWPAFPPQPRLRSLLNSKRGPPCSREEAPS